MIEDFVVALLQIVNGRLRQATFVLLHLIGAAVGFAGLLKELKRYIEGVVKVRMLCGVPLSRRYITLEFFLTQEDYYFTTAMDQSYKDSLFLFLYFCEV